MRASAFVVLFYTAVFTAAVCGQSNAMPGNHNPKFEHSNYVQFLESGGKVKVFRSIPVGVLSMKSANVLGGYLFSVHQAYDEESKTQASAVLLMPNNSRSVSKFLIDAAKIVARLPSSFMEGECYFIDQSELPDVINVLERFANYRKERPAVATHYSYTCNGGLVMMFGHEVSAPTHEGKKQRVGWRSVFGISGEMYDDNFIDRLIDILRQSQKTLKQFNLPASTK